MHNINMPKMFTLPDVTERRLVVTDVSGQPIGPIIKGQVVESFNCWTLGNGTNRLSRNVVN